MSSDIQLENGYMRIANQLIEVLAKTSLNGTQRRILDVILRQTYGYQRKEHELSVSFIAKATNIHKKQVQRELNSLIEKNIVTVISEATFNKSRILTFNKNCEGWLNSSEGTNQLPLNEIDTHTGNELAPSTGNELAPQIKKKENLKENVSKNKLKNFIDDDKEYKLANYLSKQMTQRLDRPLKDEKTLQSWAKEFDKMVRLDKLDIDEMLQVLIFSQNHKFWRSNILSASKFRKQYETLLAQMKEVDVK